MKNILKLMFIFSLTFISIDAAEIQLTGTIRDFYDYSKDNSKNPDFENSARLPSGNAGNYAVIGLVNNILTDGKPTLVGNGVGTVDGDNSTIHSITNATSFSQWYEDTSGINQSKPYTITLTKNNNVYSYENHSFFPIDNDLIGNEGDGSGNRSGYWGNNHNYHFTFDMHSNFTYQGGETFEFSGDDDVWVFINNALVIDIGGIHSSVTKSVNLDTLGLTVGQTYTFDFFFAERHITGSNFKITTSIELQPSKDYGDAPDVYPHTSHIISNNLYLGNNIPDAEENQQSSSDSTGDGADDNDGIISLSPIIIGSNTYSTTVKVFNNTNKAAYLTAWIDFNRNGVFEFNEALSSRNLSVASSNSVQNIDITWDNFSDSSTFGINNAILGKTTMRIRLTTSRVLRCASEHYTDGTDLNYGGNYFVSPDGEVEDYEVTIQDESVETTPCGTVSYSTAGDKWIEGTTHQRYVDNLDISKTITMNGTTKLRITVNGEIEHGNGADYDWIYVYDENDNVVYKDDGSLDSTPFIVDGSSVRIKLHSDGGAQGEGATVKIEGTSCTDKYDFGDAPTEYPHVSHKISDTLYMGNSIPDAEEDQQSSTDSTGDGADDSDGIISTLSPVIIDSTSYTTSVKVFNNSNSDAYLTAWIDFNRNGIFEFNEALNSRNLIVPSSSSSQNIDITWDNFTDSATFGINNAQLGKTTMRIRLTSSRVLRCAPEHYANGSDLNYGGNYFVSPDGEVEDYEVAIENPAISYDFGDAPTEYPHVSHKISDTLYMGNIKPDGENDQQSSTDSTGDGADDNDGIISALSPVIIDSTSYTTSVKVFNNSNSDAYLTAWIDFNRNGIFEFNEALNSRNLIVPSSSSSQNVDITWDNFTDSATFGINNAQLGKTTMRIRLTSSRVLRCAPEHYANGSDLNYGGNYFVSPDGEVEDYEVVIENPAIANITPIADYRFDECMWDGTNNQVLDSSGNNLHGKAIANANTNTLSIMNRSAKFEKASKQYVDIDGLDNVFGKSSTAFTVTTWLNASTLSTAKTNHQTGNTFFAKASDPKNDNIEIGVNPNGTVHVYLDTKKRDTYTDFGVAGDITTDSWHFVAVTYENGTVTVTIDNKVYTNSSKWSGATLIDQAVGSPVTIGSSIHVDNYFDGLIDEVKIFDTALSTDKLNTIYINENATKNWDGTSRIAVVCADLTPTIYVSNESIIEGNTSSKNLEFTVSLDKIPNGSVTFDYQILDGNGSYNANSPIDFTGKSILTPAFFNGDTKLYTISVPIHGDETLEEHEQFRVVLSNIQGAYIGNSFAIGTILNDDEEVSIDSEDCTNAPNDIIDFSADFEFDKNQNVSGNGEIGSIATYQNVANINGVDIDLKVKVLSLIGLDTLALPSSNTDSVPKGFKLQKIGDENSVGFFIDQKREDNKGTEYTTELEFSYVEHGTNTLVAFNFETQVYDLDNFANRTEYLRIKESDYKFFQTNDNTHIVATKEGDWSTFSNSYTEDSQFPDKDASVKFVHENKNKFTMKFTHVKNKNAGQYGGKSGFNVVFGKPRNGLPTCQVVEPKLIADYHFDECIWNGTEGEVQNNIGSIHGKAVNNLTTDTNGKVQRAGVFDKSKQQYIDFGNNYAVTDDTLTISVWFKSNSTNGEQIIYNKENSYEIAIHDGHLQYAFRPHWSWDGGTSFPVQPNTWYHVVFTYNGQEQKLYKNGVEVYKRNQTGNISDYGYSLQIGARGTGETLRNFFDGTIDEFKIYDNVLSSEDINVTYQNELAGKNWDGSERQVVVCAEPIILSIADSEVLEGDENTTMLNFTVNLDKKAGTGVTFKYQVFDGNSTNIVENATSPSDYKRDNNKTGIVMEGNIDTWTISIPVNADKAVEDDEKFTIVLSEIHGATFGNSSAVGTIINDDSAISWGQPTDLDEDNDGILDEIEFGDYPNLVKNPSFELDDCMDATRFPNAFTGRDGTFLGDDYNNNQIANWNYSSNIDCWVEGNSFALTPYGKQYIDLQGNLLVRGHDNHPYTRVEQNHLTQTITTIPGKTYRFSFWWGEDVGHKVGEPIVFTMKVIDTLNNTMLSNETLRETAEGRDTSEYAGPNTWYNYEAFFVATSTETKLDFSATPPKDNLSAGADIDMVSVKEVADHDEDGVPDFLDLDSDNDGIPDNIEAQRTQHYIVPNNEFDNHGIDTAYPDGITPVDTDNDGTVDMLDLDTDNDGIFDIVESGLGNNDDDNDGRTNNNVGDNGLDNASSYENNDSIDDVNAKAHDGLVFALQDLDHDTLANGSNATPMGRDFDYRDNSNSIPTIYISDAEIIEGNSSTSNLEIVVAIDKVATLDGVNFTYQVLDGNSNTIDENAIAPSDYTSNHVEHSESFSGVSQTFSIFIPIVGDKKVEKDEHFTVVLSNIQGAEQGQLTATGTIINDDINISNLLVVDYHFDECIWNGIHGEVKDDSVNSFDGTSKQSALTLDQGKVNRTGKFDGQGSFVSIPDNVKLNPETFTISTWVSPDNLSSWDSVVSKSSDGNWNDGWGIAIYRDSRRINFYVNSWDENNISATLPDGWSHVVASYDGDMLKIYVNGVLKDSAVYGQPLQHSASPLVIGRNNGNTYSWKGLIDEVKLFSGTLELEDIQKIYTNEQAGKNWDGTVREAVVCMPTVGVSINDISKTEEDSGTQAFTFTLHLTDMVFTDSSVQYATNDGTATNGSDYVANSGTVIFPAGVQEQNITIYVNGDTLKEGDETFYLNLSNPVNLLINDGVAMATIEDDDTIRFSIERTNSETVENSPQNLKENLYTQIVGRAFDYSLVVYDKNNNPQIIEDSTLKIELLDRNSSRVNDVLYTNYIYLSENNLQNRIDVLNDIKINRATRYADFRISYLVDENGTIVQGNYANTSDFLAKTLQVNHELHHYSNNFAIRPASFAVTVQDSDTYSNTVYRKNTYTGSERLHLSAGYDYSIVSRATMEGNTSKVLTTYNTESSDELNVTLLYKGKQVGCADINDSKLSEEGNFNYNYKNGRLIGATISHDNVGKYELHVEDINWTHVDQYEFNFGCILNSSSNTPDATGRVGCNIASNGDNVHEDIAVSFYPYAFNLSNIRFNNSNHDGRDYLYMNDLNDSTMMSVQIQSTIIAEDKQGRQLSNFTSSCEAHDLNISLDFVPTFHANYNNENGHIQIVTAKGNLVFPQQIVKMNEQVGDVNYFKNMIVKGTDFLDNNEGNLTLDVCYNMEKNKNEKINPIRIEFVKFDANSTQKVMREGEEKTVQKKVSSGQINKTRTFYYARVRADRENYPAIYTKEIKTELTIEIYCKVRQNSAWCDNTMNLRNIGLNGVNTDNGWYIDRQHSSQLDGNVTALRSTDVNFSLKSANIPAFSNGRMNNVSIVYNQEIPDGTTKTRIDIISDPWLRYSPLNIVGIPNGTPSFFVAVKSTSAITGAGKNGNTMDTTKRAKPNGKMDW